MDMESTLCLKQKYLVLHLSGEYKFYLAFENAMCDDYATEKFFNIIRELPTVPGANVINILWA